MKIQLKESNSDYNDDFEKEWQSLGINTNTSVYTLSELSDLFKKVRNMKWRKNRT